MSENIISYPKMINKFCRFCGSDKITPSKDLKDYMYCNNCHKRSLIKWVKPQTTEEKEGISK